MALIKCSECDKSISSNAPFCPHCGKPNKQSTLKGIKPFLRVIGIVFTLLTSAIFVSFFYAYKEYSIDLKFSEALSRYGTFEYDKYTGEIVVPSIGGEDYILESNGSIVKRNNENNIISDQYDYHSPFENGMAAVEKDGKWGFINEKGKVLIPIEYDNVQHFYNGMAAVKKDGKEGAINKKGKVKVPLKYDYVQSFTSRNIAGVNSNGKWGIVDSEGRELISPKYNWIKAFDHSDLLVATLDGVKYGFIDKNDRQIIPFDYTIESTSDYGWIVSIYDENSYSYDDYKPKYVFISYEGAISSTFDRIAAGYSSEAGQHIIPFSEGLTWVQNQEIYDLRDTKMKSVKSFQLSEARQFSDGLAAVKSENKKWAYVNKKGKFVTPNLNYDNVGEFVEGLAPVYSGEKIGFINRKGVEVSPCIYDYPPISDCDAIWYLNFRNGLAAVCKKVKNDWAGGYDEKNYKWGFINNKGEEVVPCVIDVIGGCDYDFPFIAKRILATIDGEYCFIKKTGQVINKNFSSTTNILSYIKQLIGIKKQTGNINVNYDEVYSRNNYRSSSTSKNIVMNFEIEYENGIPKRTIYQNNIGLTEYNNLDLFTNFITIPEGKMWIFKRAIHMDKFSGGSIEWAPHLLFYPNGKGGRYQKLNLSERGKGLILNSGDEFRIKLRKPAGGDGIITFELCFLEQFE